MSTDKSVNTSQENINLSNNMHNSSNIEPYIYYFFVIYNKEGLEMVSLRKNFVEDQKVMLSNMILAYPGYTLKTVAVDFRRFARPQIKNS